ncbi:metal-dependent hydrolase [Aliidiomarina minuta]|uniref:Metal-dependent hydrolase n=1 Tax=Aliidiomarina minuta TaxID=880057 RepID=A0A432W6F3_9GAMM|nr:TatD family hydrolase [Aliidiomarina minuta]RUO25647.1 metal-dependent hydrolase [Aliidiomarina minuta]
MYVDSHCHLDKIKRASTDGMQSVIDKARQEGVEHMLCVGVTLEDFAAMEEQIAPFSEVSMSCGLHPLYIAKNLPDYDALAEICARPDVVAVGETGLDYFYDKEHHQRQQESFGKHIELANKVNKPLIIHTRDAREDTISMLREGHAERCGGVLHCFTESQEMADQALELGFYISISGIVTFANAKALREVVKNIPLEHLLIETDSPWLAPVPHRGKENEPAYVSHVAECVAELKGISKAEVAAETRANFYRLFDQVKR